MKRLLQALGLVGLVWAVLSGPAVRAETDFAVAVSVNRVSDFYGPLGQSGHWVQVAPYGWCWYPGYVAADWQPYADGHWEWSDGGWYWVSDESWAWATYHYGRWLWHPYYRWVWVPGLQWAPSWVAWREGGDYIGWAPLPPDCDFGGRDEIYFDRVVIVPHAYVFVNQHHFCHQIGPSVIIHNETIINKTVIKTKIKQVNHVVINEGPRLADIEQASGEKVRVTRGRHQMTPAEYQRLAADRPPRRPSVTKDGDRPAAPTVSGDTRPSGRQENRGRDRTADQVDRPNRPEKMTPTEKVEKPQKQTAPQVLRPSPAAPRPQVTTPAPSPSSTPTSEPAVRNYRARDQRVPPAVLDSPSSATLRNRDQEGPAKMQKSVQAPDPTVPTRAPRPVSTDLRPGGPQPTADHAPAPSQGQRGSDRKQQDQLSNSGTLVWPENAGQDRNREK